MIRSNDIPNEETHPWKILVVDDDEEIRAIAEFMLRGEGYVTMAAANAEQALEVLPEFGPAVVLTDALMPKKDGRELCREIKARFPGVKVIVMTSLYTAPRYRTEAYRVFHADGYLAKPIRFETLFTVVQSLLSADEERKAC